MDTKGVFYLGRNFDPAKGKTGDQPLLYDPADLTTHAFVVGMTGSGKTGMCIGMLEEAALNGIPALMIDPKGDITNLLLHFPDLLPQDFQPSVRQQVQRVKNADRQTTCRENHIERMVDVTPAVPANNEYAGRHDGNKHLDRTVKNEVVPGIDDIKTCKQDSQHRHQHFGPCRQDRHGSFS